MDNKTDIKKLQKKGLAISFGIAAAMIGTVAAHLMPLTNTDQGEVIEVIENQKCGFLPGNGFKVLHSSPKLTETSFSSGMTHVVWGPADYKGEYKRDPLSSKWRAINSDNCVPYDYAVKLDTDGDSVADLKLTAGNLLKDRTVYRVHDEFRQRSDVERVQVGDTLQFTYQEPFIQQFFPQHPARPHPSGRPELGSLQQYYDIEGWLTRIQEIEVIKKALPALEIK